MSEEHVELARRCLAGDASALREFVEVYQQQVFALCLRMLRHRQDAEDTAQDSLLRAVRYLGSWDSSQPLTPWVLKIAANRCRTALGKRGRVPLATEAVEETCAPQERQYGLAEELELALETLNEQQRTCFVLFYEQELSVAEISAIMEVPDGTVKTWLHRSRKQLAQRLRGRGFAPQQREE